MKPTSNDKQACACGGWTNADGSGKHHSTCKQKRSTMRVMTPRRTDAGDWRVGVLVNDRDDEALAYYTDDLADARDTAQAMRKDLES